MAFSYFLKENLVSKHRQMITKTTRTHTPPTHAHTATYTREDFDYLILFDYFLIWEFQHVYWCKLKLISTECGMYTMCGWFWFISYSKLLKYIQFKQILTIFQKILKIWNPLKKNNTSFKGPKIKFYCIQIVL